MAYLNLLNSRNHKGESDEILLSYLKERNRGILIGSSFLTLSSLIIISLIIKGLFLEYRKKNYIKDALIYDETILKTQEIKKEYKKIKNQNKKIISSIMALRSNLNIMNELKKIIPRDLFLNELKILSNVAIFKGKVNNNLGVKIINAFILGLKKSSLFIEETVILKEIKYNKTLNTFEFTINATFFENMSNINLEMMMNKNNNKKGLFKKFLIMESYQLLDIKNNP